jgi:predicted porin
VGIGLNYANGPINLDAVYQSRLDVQPVSQAAAPGFGQNINEWYVGASWDFKVVKIYGSYQALDNDNRNVVGGLLTKGGIDSSDLWTVGVSAPIGRGTFGLSYGRITTDHHLAAVSDGVSWGAGAQYTYPLSKRTSLYGAYSYYNNNKWVSPASAGQAIAIPGSVAEPGENNYAVGLGITHSF